MEKGGVKNTNTYTVTFDPNGGEVTQSTKEVVYNELYGELPIPTKEGNVPITDNSGNTVLCPVNVYVDKTAPTCELEVTSGTKEKTGWYSGEVKVQLKNQKDADSGLLTYGIGTSIKERNYNKETVITLKEGMTSVIGYVKDAAGNEGLCSIDVRVGTEKPQFDFRYGYQIYPNKESYKLTNINESNGLTTTSTTPEIEFTGLEK